MAKELKMFVVVVLMVWAFSGVAVSAQTHHVVGGDGAWGSSLSDRVVRVGDKIWFMYPATKESVLEVQSLEEFESCDLKNPIKMYTDGPVTLDKQGVRYFTSGNPESCKNGLKLPVSVQPFGPSDFGPPEFGPPEPYHKPPPSFEPPPYIRPPPVEPSASTKMNGLSFVLLAGLGLYYLGL